MEFMKMYSRYRKIFLVFIPVLVLLIIVYSFISVAGFLFGIIEVGKLFGIYKYDRSVEYGEVGISTNSNFGSEEYKCTGFCFCENSFTSEHRRVGSIPLTRSVSLILTAISSVAAYHIATKLMDEKCISTLSTSSSCTIDSIHSEIDTCEINHHHIGYSLSESETETSKKDDQEQNPIQKWRDYFGEEWWDQFHSTYDNGLDLILKMDQSYQKKVYLCSGRCLKLSSSEFSFAKENAEIEDPTISQKLQNIWEETDCEVFDFKIRKNVNLPSDEFLSSDDNQFYPQESQSELVELDFMTRDLEEFCNQKPSDNEVLRNDEVPICKGSSVESGVPENQFAICINHEELMEE